MMRFKLVKEKEKKYTSILVFSMKLIVTHQSPDADAIVSVWLIKRFLQGWEDAEVKFVSAGEKLSGNYEKEGEEIEIVDGRQIIHVDTGLGKLDHHQTDDDSISAASLTLDFIKRSIKDKDQLKHKKFLALERIVKLVVETDHFKELFRPKPLDDYHDFSFVGILDGRKTEYPENHNSNLEFGFSCLDALLHTFENKIWAEEEIEKKGIPFKTRWGQALAIETQNDDVLKIGQMMGYKIVIKKDPKYGYVRIKGVPSNSSAPSDVDLTPIYENLKKIDPSATWFLHVSRKMLLNGSSKSTDNKPSMLTLLKIKEVVENS